MSKEIKILISGDTHLGGGRLIDAVAESSAKQIIGNFYDRIKNADLAVTNLESPLVDKGFPIPKTGPNLKSPTQSLSILNQAGIDLVTLANNHIMDYGEDGLFSTLAACEKAGIGTVGAGKDWENSKEPFIKVIENTRIGIINIAENEFSTTENHSAGAHALNPVKNYYNIKEHSESVDHLIVVIHGGHEHYPLPSPRMKQTYRFFVDAGADAVVGHHPHCFSGYEVYNGAPIFYSIGNFLFDKGSAPVSSWNQGFMVELQILADKADFEIIPYIQNAETAGLRKMNGNERTLFNTKISELNADIEDDQKLENKFNEFCETSRNQYSSYIEPYSNKYLHALRNRNLFPSLLSKRKKRLWLNLIRCEAHKDVLQKILRK